MLKQDLQQGASSGSPLYSEKQLVELVLSAKLFTQQSMTCRRAYLVDWIIKVAESVKQKLNNNGIHICRDSYHSLTLDIFEQNLKFIVLLKQ